MISKKIIRSYKINTSNESISDPKNIPDIVKIPDVSLQEVKIPSENNQEHKDASIKVHKDSDSVVTGIEITCSCGEKILIKLEY